MTSGNDYLSVKSHSIGVDISPQGEIISIGRGTIRRSVSGMTGLVGYAKLAHVESREMDCGGYEFTKTVTDEGGYRQRKIVERFIPTEDSVRWEIDILNEATPGSYSDRYDGEPWSTEIETRFRYENASQAKFWTAWADPDVTLEDAIRAEQSRGNLHARRESGWTDPLTPMPFADGKLWYGAAHWKPGDQNIFVNPLHFDLFCIPFATVIEEPEDIGFSLVLSLEDTILDMAMTTDERGGITFSRSNHRISRDQPVHFTIDLIAHEADWRPGIKWMADRYPEFFNPINPLADEIAGCGSYARKEEGFDPEKLKAMGYTVNWNANFDFPYMGLYLPPVASDDEQWQGWRWDVVDGVYTGSRWTTSIATMREYAREMREMGFYNLSYFNFNDYGLYMKYPFPKYEELEEMDESDWWKDPYRVIYEKFDNALLRTPSGRPIFSWEDSVAVDAGDPVRLQHILDDAKRHIDYIPDSSGIVVDRLDWIRLYNERADDGVSLIGGRPARSGVCSWQDLLSKLGPMMHDANKVIFINNHDKRIDIQREADAIFCEFAAAAAALNLTGLLCMRMPGVGFVCSGPDMRPTPDDYLQRYIHMGVFPAAPVPGNDHCLLPSPSVDQLYLDYGQILIALRGRKWVLEPHVVEVAGDTAKANVFETPDWYLVTITLAKENSARVVLRNLSIDSESVCEVFSPGDQGWAKLELVETPNGFAAEPPVKRGCAVIRLSKVANAAGPKNT